MQLLKLFYVFFTIGLFSVGGGYAIIPLIQEQVVNQHGWIAQQTFTDIIIISQMTPGPLAVNTATFVGIQIWGVIGAIVATVSCISAGVFISIGLYRFFQKHHKSQIALEVLNGLKASSLGLIISAAAVILLLAFTGSEQLSSNMSFDWAAVAVFVGAFIVLKKWKLNPILVIAITGVIGAFIY